MLIGRFVKFPKYEKVIAGVSHAYHFRLALKMKQQNLKHHSCLKSGHLTHLPLDKMAASSQMIFSVAFSWMIFFLVLINISLKFVSKRQNDNDQASTGLDMA